MKYDSGKLLFAVDLAGTLLFGIEGATAAIAGHLDFLGLMVLAFATALAGGIIRDLLIGAVPPNSLRDWRYSAMAFTGAAIVFFLHRFVQGIPSAVIVVLDAAGLALFAVAGTEKALLYKMHPFLASGNDPGSKPRITSRSGRHRGRGSLFRLASGQRLAALESADS